MENDVFIETHYSYCSHERPWHFFQFSENALDALFPEKFGMQCLKKGCSNPIEGKFTEYATEDLAGMAVRGMYCHSGYLGKKIKEVEKISLDELFCMGGSSGGARPKILTSVDDEEWLIKFPSIDDNKNIGRQEYEYSLCAKACGMQMEQKSGII